MTPTKGRIQDISGAAPEMDLLRELNTLFNKYIPSIGAGQVNSVILSTIVMNMCAQLGVETAVAVLKDMVEHTPLLYEQNLQMFSEMEKEKGTTQH